MQAFILQFLDQLYPGGYISFCKLHYFLSLNNCCMVWCVQCVSFPKLNSGKNLSCWLPNWNA
jgi:hypothetical protein